jgi:hypothetical protein
MIAMSFMLDPLVHPFFGDLIWMGGSAGVLLALVIIVLLLRR